MRLLLLILWLAGLAIPVSALAPEEETKPSPLKLEVPLVPAGKMDLDKMETILKAVSKIQEGVRGRWFVVFEGRHLIVMTDESHNRMRVITPVIEVGKLEAKDHELLLKANFDTALDARYALFEGYLWSVYIHPLAELSSAQFLDALKQVKMLADTYGATYSSTTMVFGGNQ